MQKIKITCKWEGLTCTYGNHSGGMTPTHGLSSWCSETSSCRGIPWHSWKFQKNKRCFSYTKIKMINLRNKTNEHGGEKTNMRVFASMDLVRSLRLNSSFIISWQSTSPCSFNIDMHMHMHMHMYMYMHMHLRVGSKIWTTIELAANLYL